MAVIFPFEKKLYQSSNIPVSFVGHPLVEDRMEKVDVDSLKTQLNIPHNKPILAMLPGSRTHEIKRLMPVLSEAARRLLTLHPELHFVIPVASCLKKDSIAEYLKDLPHTLVDGQAVETMSCADAVVVASGTASLECALLKKPMCIVYKSSHLTFMAACAYIKIKYIGLCNVLENKMLVPELVQYDCNPEELTKTIHQLLSNQSMTTAMVSRLEHLCVSLSNQDADLTMTTLIEQELLA